MNDLGLTLEEVDAHTDAIMKAGNKSAPAILFITAGDITWASSRFRCFWPAKYMPGAGVVQIDELLKAGGLPEGFDAYVFQKRADISLLEQAKETGKPIFWDVCDPVWWWDPEGSREIVEYMTGVVASNDGLRSDFVSWFCETHKHDESATGIPIMTIPDRFELSHFPKKRQHQDVSPVRFIWFGLAPNRISIFGAIPYLERLVANGYEISLTIMDNQPNLDFGVFQPTDQFPIYYVKWELDKENEIIASHDIALLPPYPGPWGEVKSENKHITAMLCGLPVVDGTDYEYLEGVINRRGEKMSLPDLSFDSRKDKYDVRLSAQEWLDLVKEYL